MEIKDIKRILDAISHSDVNEFKYEKGDFRLEVKRQTAQANYGHVNQAVSTLPIPVQDVPVSSVAQDEDHLVSGIAEAGSSENSLVHNVMAPIVGTFYLSPAPEAPPYVKVGDQVEEGTVLCIIEAMKLMNEIEAEQSGTITEILVQNEDPVEYGQLLFRIDPAQ